MACSAAPSHDQANAECPCRALHGEKWSDDIAASNPAASACWTAASSALGWTCSWEQCNPNTGMPGITRPGDPVTHPTCTHRRPGPGYADPVIAFFSSRLGCLGSLLVSALLTALVILVLYR